MPVPVNLNGVRPGLAGAPLPRMEGAVRELWESRGAGSSASLHIIEAASRVPISNQAGESSCVANATCDGLEICAVRDGRPHVDLSRNAHYYWTRCLHGAQNEDAGTHISLSLRQAATLGVIPESQWPYVEERVNKAPTNDEILLASQNLVTGSYELYGSGEDKGDMLRLALRADQPVIGAFWLGPEYRNPSPGQVMGVPGSRWGLHAQLFVGYRKGSGGEYEYLVRNSWGEGWGLDGYIWVKSEYACDDRYVFDTYAFTNLPELVL